MDKFLDNWLPNIVVQTIFWLFDHITIAWAAIAAVLYLVRRVLTMVQKSMTASSAGDLVPDQSWGRISGVAVSTSMATAHLTAATPAKTLAVPNIPYSSWHRDSDETYHAAQEVLRFERNKTAAFGSR
jgi:hypothetical protein